MSDHSSRYVRLRYTATGALAALAGVGAIAGAEALAAQPQAGAHRHTVAHGSTAQVPSCPMPSKTQASQPAPSPQPFLHAVAQLVDNGTITASEGQAVDHEILAGQIDTSTLASDGFTPSQLEALQQVLSTTKQGLASAMVRRTK
jgi:hypothetical protein